ncbi:Stress response protein YsnF [Massilia sp. LC238]|nr:Stress response protein YsnF [Massilia sp. LC238]
MQHTLVAVFDDRTDAQNAMNELLSSGFSTQDVRLSSSDTTSATATPMTTTTGSDTGIGSGIKNFFGDLFGSDDNEHSTRYQGAVSGGKNVITVTADSLEEVERAADIVEGFGPIDIDEHSSGMDASGAMLAGSQSGMSLSSMSAQSATTQQQSALTGSSMQRDTATQSIPVVEEQLKVGKREVQRGGVRIFSRVVETPVNETIALREEHVEVQRRAVNQPISPTDAAAFKEQTIEMRESAEEAVVEKSARVVEEVTIGKQVNQRQENITDTVRHTEVEVEHLGATGTASTQDDTYYRTHFQSNYSTAGGSYDDYAPAYTYGSQMRSQYSGRQWDDVETNLRTDWETRHGSATGSTWEKMKAAVRHGWDRMTDDNSTGRSY